MSLEVVDADQGSSEGDGKRLGETESNEKAPCQPGPVGYRDRREVGRLDIGAAEGVAHHRHDEPLMGARGDFGDDSAVEAVIELGGHDVGPQASIDHYGRSRIVARAFDTEEGHGVWHR